MRNLGQVMQVYHRNVKTNQRIYFDILKDFNYLGTGNDDGTIKLFDLNEKEDEKEFYVQKMHEDCLNGLNFHPSLPLLATASGQRKYLKPTSSKAAIKSNDSESSDSDAESNSFENSLKIWKHSFDRIKIT